MVATKLMTIEELELMSVDDKSFELIDGELFEMSPAGSNHLLVVSRLTKALILYASARTNVHVLTGHGGFILRRTPDTLLEPDIVVVDDEQKASIAAAGDRFTETRPSIVIEVKSPSDREAQIARKLEKYLSAGVGEVWWVRPAERQVSIHRLDQATEIIQGTTLLSGSGFLPGLQLSLSEIFGE